MGLEFCFEFRIAADARDARRIVVALHNEAHRQSFDTVHELREIDAPDGHSLTPGISADEADTVGFYGAWWEEYRLPDGCEVGIRIPPRHALRFVAHTNGAETVMFGLASHPAMHTHIEDGRAFEIATGLEGVYLWHSCCKTQYAGLPQRGGIPNFLRAHYALVNMCDAARKLGIDVTVRDGGGFWDHRDEKKLLVKLDEWNELVAAVCGPIKDALRGQSGLSITPITARPDFEHLEARGIRRLGEKREEEMADEDHASSPEDNT